MAEDRNLMGRLTQTDLDQRAAEDDADEKRNEALHERMLGEYSERVERRARRLAAERKPEDGASGAT